MNVYADAWSHAQNVRMWVHQAQSELGTVEPQASGRWLGRRSRRSTARTNIDQAANALAQARLAWKDLVYWLQCAGYRNPQAPETLAEHFLVKQKGGGVVWEIEDVVVNAKREVLQQDLAMLDKLVEFLDAKRASA
jgi:hypothetical protein